jgi:hypothetical protein
VVHAIVRAAVVGRAAGDSVEGGANADAADIRDQARGEQSLDGDNGRALRGKSDRAQERD